MFQAHTLIHHPFTQPQISDFHILACNKTILVKQRNLNAAAADIYDRRSFLDDTVEFIFPGCDRFIIHKTL